jgi:hypothetical protein
LCLPPLHLKVPAQYSTNPHIFHYKTPFTCKYTLTNPCGDFVLRLTGMMILQPATWLKTLKRKHQVNSMHGDITRFEHPTWGPEVANKRLSIGFHLASAEYFLR